MTWQQPLFSSGAGGNLGLLPTTFLDRPQRQAQVVVQNFQSGHGFTHGGTGTQTDDTSFYTNGQQSVRLTTDGAGNACSTSHTGLTAVDFTGKRIMFYIAASDWTRVNACDLYITSDTFTNYNILHALTFANRTTDQIPNANEWVGISCSWADLSAGGGTGALRTAVSGYKLSVADTGGIDGLGPVSVWINGIANIAEPSAGMLTLCFDDARAGQWTQAQGYMAKYGLRGTVFVIVDVILAQNPAYMTLAQLQQLQDPLGWEIASHSYTVAAHNALPNGYGSLPPGQVDGEMSNVKQWLLLNGFRGGDTFAWPGGHWNNPSGTNPVAYLAQKYFNCGRGLLSGAMESQRQPSVPSRMRARDVAVGDSVATINGLIDAAVSNKWWLVLVFHEIDNTGNPGTYSIANFQAVMDHVNSSGIATLPMGEAIRFAT